MGNIPVEKERMIRQDLENGNISVGKERRVRQDFEKWEIYP